MKTLSLKLDTAIFEETERLVEHLNMPRNRYINEALAYYNRVQNHLFLKKQLALESGLVREESMSILMEFEGIEPDDEAV